LELLVPRDNSDEAKIAALADKFAVAVDQSDRATIITLLCAEEASAITEDEDYDPSDNGPVVTGQPKKAVTTSVIRSPATRPART
jgi:hypothetical protein